MDQMRFIAVIRERYERVRALRPRQLNVQRINRRSRFLDILSEWQKFYAIYVAKKRNGRRMRKANQVASVITEIYLFSYWSFYLIALFSKFTASLTTIITWVYFIIILRQIIRIYFLLYKQKKLVEHWNDSFQRLCMFQGRLNFNQENEMNIAGEHNPRIHARQLRKVRARMLAEL